MAAASPFKHTKEEVLRRLVLYAQGIAEVSATRDEAKSEPSLRMKWRHQDRAIAFLSGQGLGWKDTTTLTQTLQLFASSKETSAFIEGLDDPVLFLRIFRMDRAISGLRATRSQRVASAARGLPLGTLLNPDSIPPTESPLETPLERLLYFITCAYT